MMQLTKNFALSEIDNGDKLQPWQVRSLYCLLLFNVQPLREAMGLPIAFSVGGGFRLEQVVGGSLTSEHLFGSAKPADDPAAWIAALDFTFKGRENDHQLRLRAYKWLMDNCRYSIGQLIYYVETNHLHISLATKAHRGEFMVCVNKVQHDYRPVLHIGHIVQVDKRLKMEQA